MSFNKLTPEQAERLALLAEECGELVQAIGKVLRHGYDSHDPTNPNHRGNRDDVAKECGDVCFAVCLLGDAGDISNSVRDYYFSEKEKSVGKYLHHAKVQP